MSCKNAVLYYSYDSLSSSIINGISCYSADDVCSTSSLSRSSQGRRLLDSAHGLLECVEAWIVYPGFLLSYYFMPSLYCHASYIGTWHRVSQSCEDIGNHL